MKKIIFLMLIIIFFSFGTIHALNAEQINSIDQVITRWHARQPENMLISRVKTILIRIDDIQQRARMSQKTAEMLEYVELRLQKILLAATTPGGITSGTMISALPTVTSAVFPNTIQIPTQRETRPLIIGGGSPTLMSVIEFAVSSEPMILETINIYTSREELPEYVAQAGLYDEFGTLIDTTTVTNDTIRFDGISLEQKLGSHKVYVSILPYWSDTYQTPEPLTFSAASYGITAQGSVSRKEITKTGTVGSATFTTVTIAPVGIDMVKFVANRQGNTPDTFLTTPNTTLGILEITTPTIVSRYSKDIIIDTITVIVNDSTTARSVASNLYLERIDINSATTLAGVVNGNTVVFTLSNANAINTIQQGQSIAFRFLADITLNPTIRESAKLSIHNLKNGGITYHARTTTTPITTIQQREWQTESARISD